MRTRKQFGHISAAWALLAVLFAVSATPSLALLECGATQWTRDSYQAAVHVLAAARIWSRLARLWIDPLAVPSAETSRAAANHG